MDKVVKIFGHLFECDGSHVEVIVKLTDSADKSVGTRTTASECSSDVSVGGFGNGVGQRTNKIRTRGGDCGKLHFCSDTTGTEVAANRKTGDSFDSGSSGCSDGLFGSTRDAASYVSGSINSIKRAFFCEDEMEELNNDEYPTTKLKVRLKDIYQEQGENGEEREKRQQAIDQKRKKQSSRRNHEKHRKNQKHEDPSLPSNDGNGLINPENADFEEHEIAGVPSHKSRGSKSRGSHKSRGSQKSRVSKGSRIEVESVTYSETKEILKDGNYFAEVVGRKLLADDAEAESKRRKEIEALTSTEVGGKFKFRNYLTGIFCRPKARTFKPFQKLRSTFSRNRKGGKKKLHQRRYKAWGLKQEDSERERALQRVLIEESWALNKKKELKSSRKNRTSKKASF